MQAIVRTKKSDLLIGKIYSDTIKLNNDEFDVAVIDEYKLINQLRRGIINTIEVFYKAPIYLNPEYKETSDYLHKHVHELIISHPVELMGGCYGYYRSYAKDVSEVTIEVGSDFPGKRFAMALKSKKIAETLIHSPFDKEKLKLSIIPKGEYKETLLALKNTKKITDNEQAQRFISLSKELSEYLEVLDHTKRHAIEITTIQPEEKYITHLIDKLLPPV